MTSLYMGHLATGGIVPADEKAVRNTALPVNDDKPASMAEDMPEQQEFQSDPDPNLGMHHRQLGSTWVSGENVEVFAPEVAQVTEATRIVNSQVSTSGTAASREMAKQHVHKTLSYAVGIEPVSDLRENGKFGNYYFKRHERDVQSTMNNEMSTPPGYDQRTTTEVVARGKSAAREAGSNPYQVFWNGGQ